MGRTVRWGAVGDASAGAAEARKASRHQCCLAVCPVGCLPSWLAGSLLERLTLPPLAGSRLVSWLLASHSLRTGRCSTQAGRCGPMFAFCNVTREVGGHRWGGGNAWDGAVAGWKQGELHCGSVKSVNREQPAGLGGAAQHKLAHKQQAGAALHCAASPAPALPGCPLSSASPLRCTAPALPGCPLFVCLPHSPTASGL